MQKVGKRWLGRIGQGWRKQWRIVGQQIQPVVPGMGAALLAIALGHLGLWAPLERLGYNRLLTLRSQLLPQAWDQRVVVVAIDEASLKQYGRFPWNRDRYRQLLQALEPALPAVIGFDILFIEPSPEDGALAAALAMSGNSVLASGADRQGRSLEVVPALAQVTHQGHVYHAEAPDGISRQSWLYINQTPSLSIRMTQIYTESLQATFGSNSALDDIAPIVIPPPIPELPEQPVWINWIDSTDKFLTYSFVDVANGKVPTSAFTNKLVLVGVTAAGFDPIQTPFNKQVPTGGVYLQAAAIDNLLNQRFITPLPTTVTSVLLLAIALLTSGLLFHQSLKARVFSVTGLILLWLMLALGLISIANLWLAIAAPVGTILLTIAGIQLREQHEKQLLMRLFAKHVAPETAKMLWQRKTEIFQEGELQAQELVATVLFMDIRGFTTISEQLLPSELLPWVNRYLESMTDCIMNHGGVVDKYIGDAIMAVFGVPFPRTNRAEIQQDALNAIAASLAMHQRLQVLNQEFAAEGKPLIQFGIGIHTGLVIAGSVGGGRRLNYSVLGDVVNTAARIESMNKEIQVNNPYNLLVSSETASCICHHYSTQSVGSIHLRGREQATLICTILGENTGLANVLAEI